MFFFRSNYFGPFIIYGVMSPWLAKAVLKIQCLLETGHNWTNTEHFAKNSFYFVEHTQISRSHIWAKLHHHKSTGKISQCRWLLLLPNPARQFSPALNEWYVECKWKILFLKILFPMCNLSINTLRFNFCICSSTSISLEPQPFSFSLSLFLGVVFCFIYSGFFVFGKIVCWVPNCCWEIVFAFFLCDFLAECRAFHPYLWCNLRQLLTDLEEVEEVNKQLNQM